jgi:lauroyl/myristoyl acyltransferase
VIDLTEFSYALGWQAVKLLPRAVSWPVFAGAAEIAALQGGTGTRRLEANLRRVVGPDADLDSLVRAGLRSYARYWLEAFRLPALSREDILRSFHVDGEDKLTAHMAAGQGVVVALPHCANWDLAGAWVAAKGWPITTVAQRLKPENMYQRFLEYRRGLGMEILPTHGGDRPTFDVLLDRVNQGSIVPLLADRDISARGVEVDFFGGTARMPAGPALLAVRTGAPLYTTALWFDGDRTCARIDGPLPVPVDGPLDVRVRRLTQQVADGLAKGIAAHPEDWHMLQKVWSSPGGSAGVASSPGGPGAQTRS